MLRKLALPFVLAAAAALAGCAVGDDANRSRTNTNSATTNGSPAREGAVETTNMPSNTNGNTVSSNTGVVTNNNGNTNTAGVSTTNANNHNGNTNHNSNAGRNHNNNNH